MKLPNWYVHDPPMVEDLLEALVGPKGRELPEKMGSIQELARASPSELQDHLTPVKALRLVATFRLNPGSPSRVSYGKTDQACS